MSDAVSVVIAAHTLRRSDDLVKAARSALAQGPREVIVSVDHNADLVRFVVETLPEVTVVENTRSPGASGTRNRGAESAQTPLVAFLDDDAHALPGWLDRLVAPFEDAQVVGTGGGVDPDWRTRRPSWFPDEFAWVVGASFRGQPTRTAVVRNVWSENMAIRRDVFLREGGFREGFGKVGARSSPEDTDLCIRMASGGGRWMYVPDARVNHAVPGERATFGFFVSRCWLEGRGKVAMTQLLADDSDLSDERSYLTKTVPTGVAHGLRDAVTGEPRAAGRSAAIMSGLAAAGAGAAFELASGALERRRAARVHS